MDTSRWKRVIQTFEQVADMSPDQRDAFLQRLGREDPAMREEVASLLDHDDANDSDLRGAVVAAAGRLPDLQDVAGERLGPYRLVRELGRGGMGMVWLAVRDDDAYRQQVAIKLLRRAASEDARARFLAERQILASLDHPNIARLLDGGTTADGTPYVVMEHVDGEPVDDYCRNQKLSIDQRARLVGEVCDAVQFAHRNLIVHRDIKPSNILVDKTGTPKLLDFGIAKLLDADALEVSTPETMTGTQVLTPQYASPEQIRGQRVTTASDVYSLGVLLYEILAEQGPYQDVAQDPIALARAICEKTPQRPSTVIRSGEERRGFVADPALVAKSVSGDLDNIVLKAMEKEPVRRYATAGELAEDLRRHRERLPVIARPATLRYRFGRFCSRHRYAVTAGVVAILLLVAATAFSLTQMSAAVSASERLRVEARRATLEAARVNLDAGALDVARTMIESIPEAERDWAWHHMHSLLDRSIARIDLGNPLCTGLTASGDQLITVSASGLIEWHDPFLASVVQSVDFERTIADASFSGDGLRLALLEKDATSARVTVWSLADRLRPELLVEHTLEDAIDRVAMASNGFVYAAASSGRIRAWDLRSGPLVTQPHDLGAELLALGDGGRHVVAGSRSENGRLRARIYDLEARSSQDVRADAASVTLSPDEQLIVEGRVGGLTRIRRTKSARSVNQFMGDGASQFVQQRGNIETVAVDPTGAWIASGSSNGSVWVWHAAEKYRPRVLFGHDASVEVVRFSADGQRVLSVDAAGQARLWEFSLEPSRLTLGGFQRRALGIGYQPGESRLILASSRGDLMFWDSESLEQFDHVSLSDFALDSFAASPVGDLFATGFGSQISLRDMRSPHDGEPLTPVFDRPARLRFSPGGDRLVVLDESGALTTYDTETREAQTSVSSTHDVDEGALVFSADGETVISAHVGSILARTTTSGEQRFLYERDGFAANAVALSPDGRTLASGWHDGTVLLHDASTGRVRKVLDGQTGAIYSPAFSPDAKTLASGAADGTTAIRDVETSQLSILLRARAARIADLIFHDDGQTLFTAGNRLRVWTTRPARELWELSAPGRPAAIDAQKRFDQMFAQPREIHSALGQLRADPQLESDVRRALLALALNPRPAKRDSSFTPPGRSCLELAESESRIIVDPVSPLHVGRTMTVEAWIKPSTFDVAPRGDRLTAAGSWHDAGRYIAAKDSEFRLALDISGRLFWLIRTPRGWTPGMFARYVVPSDRWSHVAWVKDSDVVRLYLDGHLIQQRQIPGADVIPAARSQVFGIGGLSSNETNFAGSIGNVRVWKSARTAEQIRQSMSRHVAADEPGLLSSWRMEEGDGLVIRDESGGNSGRIIDARWCRH